MTVKKKKAILSKSTFIKGLQCRKALYLYKNRYFLRDPLSPEQRAKFTRGTHVGIFARELFPGGVDASPKTHFQMAKSVEKTRELIEKGETDVIYEAAFSYDDVVVALDILYRENGSWRGIEVKSSKAVSETYHWDAALQYYVIKGSGVELENFYIAYVDKSYVKNGPVDPWKLFLLESRMDDVKLKHAEVARLVAELKETVALKSSPDIPIGTHCNNPYPCEFIGHCWKKVPPGSVFLLDGVAEEQKFAWYNQKQVRTISDLPEKLALEPEIANQIESISTGKPRVDRSRLANWLSAAKGRQVFLETFTFSAALPLFDGTSPYEVMPFGLGWMLPDAHQPHCVVMQPGQNPSEGLCDLLLEKTDDADIVWVHNASREFHLLDEYARSQPEKEQQLKQLKSRIRDLRQPLDELMVIFPAMKKLKKAEDILNHFGRDYAHLPENLMVPEEADTLYQKLVQQVGGEDQASGIASLEAYAKAKANNLKALHNLWKELGTS